MTTVKRFFAILAFEVVSLSAVFGLSGEHISFSIQFREKSIYFLGDPIWIEATIANISSQTFNFKVADNRFYNLDFMVRTPKNVRLNHAQEFTIERNSDQPVFFREVSLEPGERYGFVVELNKFMMIDATGLFVVECVFYPQLFRGNRPVEMKSNALTLHVRPPADTPEVRALFDVETGKAVLREPLPPDDVVEYTLTARQREQWEKFFLYIDLESLLRKNPEQDRTYRKLSEEDQRTMLDRYREELKLERVEQEILLVPTSFEIIKTTYTPFEGSVKVIERFRYRYYTEIKEYVYYLRRLDRFWVIYNYEIRNLGTE